MRHTQHLPTSAPPQAPDHIKCLCVVEMPVLDDRGRRTFAVTDERGWALARGVGGTDAECDDVIRQLNQVLADYIATPRPKLRLVSDA